MADKAAERHRNAVLAAYSYAKKEFEQLQQANVVDVVVVANAIFNDDDSWENVALFLGAAGIEHATVRRAHDALTRDELAKWATSAAGRRNKDVLRAVRRAHKAVKGRGEGAGHESSGMSIAKVCRRMQPGGLELAIADFESTFEHRFIVAAGSYTPGVGETGWGDLRPGTLSVERLIVHQFVPLATLHASLAAFTAPPEDGVFGRAQWMEAAAGSWRNYIYNRAAEAAADVLTRAVGLTWLEYYRIRALRINREKAAIDHLVQMPASSIMLVMNTQLELLAHATGDEGARGRFASFMRKCTRRAHHLMTTERMGAGVVRRLLGGEPEQKEIDTCLDRAYLQMEDARSLSADMARRFTSAVFPYYADNTFANPPIEKFTAASIPSFDAAPGVGHDGSPHYARLVLRTLGRWYAKAMESKSGKCAQKFAPFETAMRSVSCECIAMAARHLRVTPAPGGGTTANASPEEALVATRFLCKKRPSLSRYSLWLSAVKSPEQLQVAPVAWDARRVARLTRALLTCELDGSGVDYDAVEAQAEAVLVNASLDRACVTDNMAKALITLELVLAGMV